MTDEAKALVERLRSVDVSWSETGEWCAEAADRIEALTAEVEQARLAERAAIVAWLRDQGGYGYDDVRANCIEAGEHLK